MIIVCPDSFKGTLSSEEASRAMRRGVLAVSPDEIVLEVPVGDGGEGTVRSLAATLQRSHKVREIFCDTVDALRRPIKASYLVVDDRTAFIETAAASGLTLIKPEERDIMRADTFGTGLLIADAYRKGIRNFNICMGGTATCDGGAGALEVLHGIDFSDARFTLLCDVDNPLCGERGAAAVFGPQKGAAPEMVPVLDEKLRASARKFSKEKGIDVTDMSYAGAAGGLAGMLMALYAATPVRGIDSVLQILDFEALLKNVELVITGEGKADATTLRGKAAKGILDVASKHEVPVALIAGKVEDPELLMKAGFSAVEQATPPDPSPDVSYADYLMQASSRLFEKFLH